MTESIKAFLERMKEVGGRAFRAPWRRVNEIDPNPIFLETHGPDYKTIFFIQAGGEGDGPNFSSLRNITPKITMMSDADVKFIVHARNNWDRLIRMNEILLAACEQIGTITTADYRFNNEQLLRARINDAYEAISQCEELVK